MQRPFSFNSQGQIKPWTSRPRINRDHPLARGLSTYLYDHNGVIVDLVNNSKATLVGTSGVRGSPFGFGQKFPLTGFGFMPPLPASKLGALGQVAPYSFACATFFTGAVGPASPDGALVSIQDSSNTEATQFGCNSYPAFPGLGDVVGFVYDDTTTGFIPMQSATILQNVWQSWGTSIKNSSAADLYANGKIDSSYSGSTSSPPGHVTSPQWQFNTARSDFQDFGNAINGPFPPYVAMWGGRALVARDYQELHFRPWASYGIPLLIYPEDEVLSRRYRGLVSAAGFNPYNPWPQRAPIMAM